MGERHFLHVFSTFDPGGPQVRTAKLLEMLPRSTRHTVIAMDGRHGCAERVPGDVRLELAPRPQASGAWGVAGAMAKLLREQDPDLLLTYNFGATETLLGAWRAGFRRVVHHEEGFGPEEVDQLFWRRNVMRRALLWRARTVIVPSLNLERIARAAWKQPAERVRYLPNGVDLDRFRPGPRNFDPVVIGCVASFRAVKNQQLLLRAFARADHRDRACLRFVGDGPDLAGSRALASELEIDRQTTFVGHSDDTATAYPEMDVFVICSRTEQMPIALLEAMACELPVVGTDVGDVAQMVSESNRDWIVPPDDVDAMARVLDRVIVDADRRRAVGQANRARVVAEFEEQACLQRYLDVFDAVATR